MLYLSATNYSEFTANIMLQKDFFLVYSVDILIIHCLQLVPFSLFVLYTEIHNYH